MVSTNNSNDNAQTLNLGVKILKKIKQKEDDEIKTKLKQKNRTFIQREELTKAEIEKVLKLGKNLSGSFLEKIKKIINPN